MIMAADVMAGNVQDHKRALELVEEVEANADLTLEETVGDCAYGDSGVPVRPSPRPDGSWWRRWQTGAARPDSPKTTSGSILSR